MNFCRSLINLHAQKEQTATACNLGTDAAAAAEKWTKAGPNLRPNS